MHQSFLKLEPLLPGICEWCGNQCSDMDAACSLRCEAQLVRLEANRGRIVLRTLMKWRRSRGSEKGSIMALSSTVDGFLRDDRVRRERAQAKRREEDAKATSDPDSGVGVGR